MQGDVKAVYTATSAALVTYRTRVKGVNVVVNAAGATPVTLYDNASAGSGAKIIEIGANAVGANHVVIPGEGILAENGVYCSIGSAAQVTVIYG